jgi:hypothetical protein
MLKTKNFYFGDLVAARGQLRTATVLEKENFNLEHEAM